MNEGSSLDLFIKGSTNRIYMKSKNIVFLSSLITI
jgi:hypothetical protein